MFRRLFTTDQISIGDYRCARRRGIGIETEATLDHEIVFVRRGVFTATIGREELLLTSAHAFLLPPDMAYRIDHPTDSGDECTVFSFSAAAWNELPEISRRMFNRPYLISSAAAFMVQMQIYRDITSLSVDTLLAEECVWGLVGLLSRERGGMLRAPRVTGRGRRAVLAAQEFVAAHFDEALPLTTIAAQVGVSRFQLCRNFRAITGVSLHQFQITLRLREALRRLDEGFRDLASLALDLGFSDHSHFTNAFHREFGIAPSLFRKAKVTHLR